MSRGNYFTANHKALTVRHCYVSHRLDFYTHSNSGFTFCLKRESLRQSSFEAIMHIRRMKRYTTQEVQL